MSSFLVVMAFVFGPLVIGHWYEKSMERKRAEAYRTWCNGAHLDPNDRATKSAFDDYYDNQREV